VKAVLARRYRQAWRLYGGMGERAARGDETMEKILRSVVLLGWPRGRYGPTTRRPVGEVVHLDRYGQPFPGLRD